MTIVIPVRNEILHIDSCLDSVLAQDLAGISAEFLIVDGRSTDGTTDAIARRCSVDHRVQMLDNPAMRVSTALNIGLRAARGRVIVRMDAHSDYAKDYVRTALAVLSETGCDAVGGVQVPTPGSASRMAQAIAVMQTSRLATGGGAHRRVGYEGPAETLWLGVFGRELALRVGGFDESLFRSEDNDFFQKVRAAGGRLWVSHRIRAQYKARPSLRAFAAQNYVTGTEIIPTVLRNPRALSVRHFAPVAALALVAALATCAAVGPGVISRVTFLSAASLVVSYSSIVVMESARLCFGTGFGLFVPLVLAFLTAHVSYAAGTAVGLARQIARVAGPDMTRK